MPRGSRGPSASFSRRISRRRVWIDQRTHGIHGEGAIACIDIRETVTEDEEAIALDREVGIHARGHEGALAVVDVDTANLDTQPDLHGVGATGVGRGGRGTAQRLTEEILEKHPGASIARRVHVGDVVGDDVQLRLLRFQARYGGEECSSHDSVLLGWPLGLPV